MAFRKSLGVAVSAIALVAAATPAAARDRHHRHRDNDNGGAVAGALIIGGLLGALLASKKKPQPIIIEDAGPPPPAPAAQPVEPPSVFEDSYDEETASERCASAAELEGSHLARIAQVDRVTSVVWNGTSWTVKGNLRLADSLRDAARTSRDFRCTLKPGSAPQVTMVGAGI